MRRGSIAATAVTAAFAIGMTAGIVMPAMTSAQAAEPVDGCRVYYPAGTSIELATGARDGDCWDASQLTKDGRTFMGWSHTRIPDIMNGGDYQSVASQIVRQVTMEAPGKTVYAVWAIRPELRYDVNLPDGAASLSAAPAPVTTDFNTPASDSSGWRVGDGDKVPGYTFQGWFDTSDGDTRYDWSGVLTEPTTTVYAQWQLNAYTVRFDPNGDDATGAMEDQRFQYNVEQALNANEFQREGWVFTGWNTHPDGGGQSYQDRETVGNLTDENDGVVTLYAQWEHAPVNLIFDANGGEGSHDPVKGLAFEYVVIPDDVDESFERPGYLLTGWNTQADGQGGAYREGDQITMGSSDMTVYAVWVPAITTLPPTGGTSSDGQKTATALGWMALGGGALIAAAGGALILRRRWRRKEGDM